ncbi:MAG: chorismate synthase [Spirochaetaceae bacterium]|jgi:chorismate synthase|nr:chorismate synthase [Spirochaetaceae bacterium]
MGGNSFGTVFTVTTFGESHGPALGCVIDGCPAGVPLSVEDIRRELSRRRPGGGGPATTRSEPDEPEILSGVFEGRTLGTPIAVMVRNAAHRSGDYDDLKDLYRPGHADWVWEAKYGFRDHRGGGRSSGRETLGRVAAGAAAKSFLAGFGVTVRAWTSSAAGIDAPGPGGGGFDLDEAERNPLRVPHRETAERILRVIEERRARGDSAGGIVSCSVSGLPPGLGDPVFGKLDARIAAAMLSIGAAKAVAFGAGAAAASCGSLQNDRPIPKNAAGPLPPGVPGISCETNNAGGVLGGISTGMPLEFTVAFKPVASISKPQKTVDRYGNIRDLVIQGRHDVCVCPRAVPVVEAMAALVLADLLLLNRSGRV